MNFFNTLLSALAPAIFTNYFRPSFGTVAGIVGIASGVNSLFGGGASKGSSGGTTQQYDPYGPYRAQAATQLNQLMTDPSQAYSSPGYQQQLQQGQTSVNRGMAATGQLQSGGEQAALQNLGQNTFSSYYNNMLANLTQLSGASQSPASAGMAQAQAGNINSLMQQRNLSNITSGLGGLNTIYGGSGSGVSAWDNANAWYNSNFNSNPIQADTGAAASSASNFYGSTYDPSAGWSM